MNTKNGMCIIEFRSLYEYIILLLFYEKTVSYPCGGLKKARDHDPVSI